MILKVGETLIKKLFVYFVYKIQILDGIQLESTYINFIYFETIIYNYI